MFPFRRTPVENVFVTSSVESATSDALPLKVIVPFPKLEFNSEIAPASSRLLAKFEN